MKEIVSALIVILAVASLATVGTLAHFSDTELIPDNYLETGSLDLQLGDETPEVMRSDGTTEYPLDDGAEGHGEDPLGDSVTETWLLPNADVGDSVNSCVYVRNVGSLSGDNLSIYCSIENIDLYGGTSNKDEMLVINTLIYYNTASISIVWTDGGGQHCNPSYMANMDSDPRITLHDLKLHGIPGLPVPNSTFTRLEMSITFDVPDGIDLDQYQGDETRMTLTFNLVQ